MLPLAGDFSPRLNFVGVAEVGDTRSKFTGRLNVVGLLPVRTLGPITAPN
ncbi:hypothetical protein [Haloferax elongans]|nr:hypothetical protein [Haloferax elongans]